MDDEDDVERRLLDDPTISPALRVALMERGRGGPPATMRASIASEIGRLVENGPGASSGSQIPHAQWKIVAGTIAMGLVIGLLVWVVASLVPSRGARSMGELAADDSERLDAAIIAPEFVAHIPQVMVVVVLTDAGMPTNDGVAASPGGRSRLQRARDDSSRGVENEEDEISLITRAEGALRASSPREALQLLTEHRRRFLRGTLVEEREVLAIDALGRMNRWGEAEARAEQFLEAHPRSALAPRVRELMQRNESQQ